ncbi:MAG TPA: pyridoxal 5'-phosphate synthase glutaminase subunit PdxT [Acidobacteriaceae bacterium]|nr:pyridoxal 5'-phosphate synthase glutaminase subunit PdxT [Acidobacteriaceae bacterium]
MQRFPVIGVLALQGDYESHALALEQVNAQPKMVRTAKDLELVEGLIIPGGESTTFLKLLEREELFLPLQQFVRTRPTFGTCAGCILLAKRVTRPNQQSLGVLDATVERNAYGRQIDSEILTGPTSLPGGPLEMVFIRAPRIVELGNSVEVLAQREGSPVLVRQMNILAATFHPELSHACGMSKNGDEHISDNEDEHPDRRVHRYFAQMVEEYSRQARSGASAAHKHPAQTTAADRE